MSSPRRAGVIRVYRRRALDVPWHVRLCQHNLLLQGIAVTYFLNPTHALAAKTANMSERLLSASPPKCF